MDIYQIPTITRICGETKVLIPSQQPSNSCPPRESLKSRVGIFIQWKQCEFRHSLLFFTGSH